MATLHMDVDNVRSTYATMQQIHDDLMNQVNALMNTVHSTVGSSWQGNAATQFASEMEEWRNAANKVCEQLAVMSQRLSNEITQWEETAAALGG